MAAYAYHALMLGASDETVNQFFLTGLREIAKDGTIESLLPTVMKVGEVNLTCMAMLDAANTGTYGTPAPVRVPLKVEKGPFIVVTGHDLKDLELLLKQTEGRGANIYTHGEMLPAHAYPELKKYPQAEGEFRNSMAEPAEGICGHSGADPLYDKLPDAAEKIVCGPRVYNGSRGLSGNGAY